MYLTRQLAKKYHPDTNKEKGAKERFVEIQSAYDVSTLGLGTYCMSAEPAAHSCQYRARRSLAMTRRRPRTIRMEPRKITPVLIHLGAEVAHRSVQVASVVSKTLAAFPTLATLAPSLNPYSVHSAVVVVVGLARMQALRARRAARISKRALASRSKKLARVLRDALLCHPSSAAAPVQGAV